MQDYCEEPFDLGGGFKAKAPGQSGVAAHDCNCKCFLEYNLMTVEEFAEATGNNINEIERKYNTSDKKDMDKPDFIKIQGKENVSAEVMTLINAELDLIPKNHQKILKDYVNGIRIAEEGNSCYNRGSKIVNISKDIEQGELVHELAHAMETKLELYKNPEYFKVLNNGLDNISIGDIIYDDKTFVQPIYRLINPKFVSEYQGHIYEHDMDKNDMIDYKNSKLNTKCLGEYFSEGYREYLMNPKNLKAKDIELYEFIRGL